MKALYQTLRDMTKTTNLADFAKHVMAWNQVAEAAKGTGRTPLASQWDYIEEEFEETLTALREGNRIEVVDGACDLFVVTSYAHLLSSNVETPQNWVANLKNDFEYVPDVIFSPLTMERAVFSDRNTYSALKQSIALLFTLDINLKYNLSEVLSSNDSKYPTIAQLRTAKGKKFNGSDDSYVIESECDRIESASGGRYKGIYAKTVGDKIVFFCDTGKIMKPITFRNPKIIA